MTEPELLRTLERLENEELLDVVNPELPLPASKGGEDYLSILQDLRSALGGSEEPTEQPQPEASFPDPQNILELDRAGENALKAPDFESELELLPETAGFDFSADETEAEFSDFELKLPDEIFPQEEKSAAVESQSFEHSIEESFAAADDFDSLAGSETANFEEFAEPENLPPVFDSFTETVPAEPDVTEEADSVPLEDFLSTQKFSAEPQTTDSEISDDSFDAETEDSSFEFEPPEFFNEFVFDEASESDSNFDSTAETAEESNPTGFAFVPSVDENEFPEILHDAEDADEFSSADFTAPEDDLSSGTFADFEAESFAPETEDLSAFLPDETKDFLNELDREPEMPQFKAPEKAVETLPEPSLADEVEETPEARSPFVVFKLADRHFAFPAPAVAEIAHEPQFTALPFVPRWFSGITNLRGDVIAVLDLRGLWEMPAAAPDARRKMLVVHSERENLSVGLLVDAVSEIRYLGESEIDFAPRFFDQPFAFCVNGSSRLNESLLPLLDVERFLALPKLRQV